MSYYFPNIDPTYIYKREGTEDDPYISLKDENHVRSGAIVLKEIPSFKDKVEAFLDGEKMDKIETDNPKQNEFRVDYSSGIAYFNKNINGKKIRLEYKGTGYVSFPASRIWMIGESDDPLTSLEEALDRVDDGIEVLDTMSNFSFKDIYSDDSEYKKWNFVFFNNKTYVALEDVSGEKPNESENWRLISSGVGFAGIYDSDKVYNVGDLVSDPESKNIYFSKKDENTDELNENSWETVLTLDDLVLLVEQRLDFIDDVVDDINLKEVERKENEDSRKERFDQMLLDSESLGDLLNGEEEVRYLAEEGRKSSENNRRASELNREEKESARVSNESSRVSAEEERKEEFENLEKELESAIVDTLAAIEESKQDLKDIKTEAEVVLEEIAVDSESVETELNRFSRFRYVGEFEEDVSYKEENLVTFQGATYIALKDTEGEDIFEEEYWAIFAQKGRDDLDITIDGARPDEEGNISIEDLNVVGRTEFEESIEEIEVDLGDISNLRTARKDSVVDAINELKSRIDELIDLVN